MLKNTYFEKWIRDKYSISLDNLKEFELMGLMIEFYYYHYGSLEINKFYNYRMLMNYLERGISVVKERT